MNGSPSSQDVRLIHQNLIKVFFENENFARVHSIIEENIIDALAAREAGDLTETRGVAVLGCSGAGKTASVLQSLSQLGFERTKVGDRERPYLLVRLSANASLKGVSADCLAEIGWRARMQDSARSIWQEVTHYMRELNTFILVLDEIQHVRTTGANDRAALRDFLKSLVQPSQNMVVPIVIGMEEFREVLVSDEQLRRRYDQVHVRALSPIEDLKETVQTLDRYATKAGLSLDGSVMSRDFAERLLHASNYAFGEMCSICVAGIRRTLLDGSATIELSHFQEAYNRRADCVPALNPFIATDFQNIKPTDQTIDPNKRAD
jgi:hypothetical protein